MPLGHHFGKRCLFLQKGHYFHSIQMVSVNHPLILCLVASVKSVSDTQGPHQFCFLGWMCVPPVNLVSVRAVHWHPTLCQVQEMWCHRNSLTDIVDTSMKGSSLTRSEWENSAPLESGTKMVPQKVPFYGRLNGALWAPLIFLSVVCHHNISVRDLILY